MLLLVLEIDIVSATREGGSVSMGGRRAGRWRWDL